MSIPGLIPTECRVLAGVVAVAVACTTLFICGWTVNGWRLANDLTQARAETARVTAELTAQNEKLLLLAQEAAFQQQQAKKAQGEAELLRRKSRAHAQTILSTPASSCAEVLKENWGRT